MTVIIKVMMKVIIIIAHTGSRWRMGPKIGSRMGLKRFSKNVDVMVAVISPRYYPPIGGLMPHPSFSKSMAKGGGIPAAFRFTLTSPHELPHQRVHVHHMLLRYLFIELVHYHDREKDACSSRQCSSQIGGRCQHSYCKATHNREGPDVSVKKALKDALISPKARD